MTWLTGKTIRWTFVDGPTAGATFEHSFNDDGSVTWRALDGQWKGATAREKSYVAVKVNEKTWVISYLAASGHTLTVVLNNGRWHAVKRSTLGMYPDGRAAAAKTMPLVELGPSPDYDKVMAACGGYGERVEKPGDLEAALRRGFDAVDKGMPALLNVITQPLDF